MTAKPFADTNIATRIGWWMQDFVCTAFWQAMRKHFMPPLAGEALPASLLDRFDAADLCGRLTQALCFLAPEPLADQLMRGSSPLPHRMPIAAARDDA